jgi:protein-tyrosine phosphatase
MIERGLAHFVASDAHDCRMRSPSLLGAYASLADEWGEGAIRPLFVDNPRATLTGDILPFEPRPVVKVRRWYHFWP